jgi:hypothetical protein
MNYLGLGACVCTVVGGLYWHGDLDGGELYNKPVAQVYAAMAQTGVPTSLRGGLLTEQKITMETASDYRIKWVFRQGYHSVGALIATAKPSGDARTRVTISFEPSQANHKDQKIADAQSYAKSVGRIVLAEYLDARIEARAPNTDIIHDAMTGYIMANQEAIGRETQTMFNDVSKSLNEDMQSFAVDGAASATSPQTDLSRFDPKDSTNDVPSFDQQ